VGFLSVGWALPTIFLPACRSFYKGNMEIRHYRFLRITLNPEKCFGKPCIRSLRMPVASILSYLASGMTVEDILQEWPDLEREDIYQALGYAASAMEERVVPLEKNVGCAPRTMINIDKYQ
jgi:uncharacterized protein (DUF433 family)